MRLRLVRKKQFTVHKRCKCLSQVKGATKDVVRASWKSMALAKRGGAGMHQGRLVPCVRILAGIWCV